MEHLAHRIRRREELLNTKAGAITIIHYHLELGHPNSSCVSGFASATATNATRSMRFVYDDHHRKAVLPHTQGHDVAIRTSPCKGTSQCGGCSASQLSAGSTCARPPAPAAPSPNTHHRRCRARNRAHTQHQAGSPWRSDRLGQVTVDELDQGRGSSAKALGSSRRRLSPASRTRTASSTWPTDRSQGDLVRPARRPSDRYEPAEGPHLRAAFHGGCRYFTVKCWNITDSWAEQYAL